VQPQIHRVLRANRCFAVAPPTFPVIPITKNMCFLPILRDRALPLLVQRMSGRMARIRGSRAYRPPHVIAPRTLVNSKEDVINNLNYLDGVRDSSVPEDRKPYQALIKRGTCFLAYKSGSDVAFAPSLYNGPTALAARSDRQIWTARVGTTPAAAQVTAAAGCSEQDRYQSAI
jgi:hypothetical protein